MFGVEYIIIVTYLCVSFDELPTQFHLLSGRSRATSLGRPSLNFLTNVASPYDNTGYGGV